MTFSSQKLCLSSEVTGEHPKIFERLLTWTDLLVLKTMNVTEYISEDWTPRGYLMGTEFHLGMVKISSDI